MRPGAPRAVTARRAVLAACALLAACATAPVDAWRSDPAWPRTRDAAMAETLHERVAPEQVVLLLAGANHADATRGVPRHLPGKLTRRSVRLAAGAPAGASSAGFDETWPTPAVAVVDRCAGLAEQLAPARP